MVWQHSLWKNGLILFKVYAKLPTEIWHDNIKLNEKEKKKHNASLEVKIPEKWDQIPESSNKKKGGEKVNKKINK